jgi:hypothetical protein
MVKNLIGWMVVGVGWLLDVNDFTQLLMVHVRLDYTFDFSVTQAFKIQLQSLGDIVVVYLFADFMNSKEVVAFLHKYLCLLLITPLNLVPWHFGQAKISMYINFA